MMSTRLFIRLKCSLTSGLNEVKVPTAKGLFRNKLEKKMMEIKQSSIARKIEIAKEFFKLEMAPPKISEMKHVRDDLENIMNFFKNGTFKNLTVKDAWLYLLVSTEVGLWFFMGEVIGKRHIVGYKV